MCDNEIDSQDVEIPPMIKKGNKVRHENGSTGIAMQDQELDKTLIMVKQDDGGETPSPWDVTRTEVIT